MLGFAPALRFRHSQILCRLYKSPSEETINRGPPCVSQAKRSHTHVKDPVVHVGGLWKHQNNPSCTKMTKWPALWPVVINRSRSETPLHVISFYVTLLTEKPFHVTPLCVTETLIHVKPPYVTLFLVTTSQIKQHVTSFHIAPQHACNKMSSVQTIHTCNITSHSTSTCM